MIQHFSIVGISKRRQPVNLHLFIKMDVWRSRLDNIYNFIRKIIMVNFLYFSDFV